MDRSKAKKISNWRIQLGSPFGVHLWFDPSVESVILLSEPTGFIYLSEEKSEKHVDKPAQRDYLKGNVSVSGQAGGAERPAKIDGQGGSELDPTVPF